MNCHMYIKGKMMDFDHIAIVFCCPQCMQPFTCVTCALAAAVSNSWLTVLVPLGILAAMVDGPTRLTSTSRLLLGMTQRSAIHTRPT